jgi:hypothetical protein
MRRGSRGSASIAAVVVLGLLASSVLLGTGNRNASSSIVDGVSWLLSLGDGGARATRVNGASGQAEKRVVFQGVDGLVEIIDGDGITLVRSGDTVHRLDEDTLTAVEAGTRVAQAQRIVVGDGMVFVVDGEVGEVWAADASTLARQGRKTDLGEPLSSAVFAADDHLWVAAPGTGEVMSLTASGGSASQLDERLDVAQPGALEVLLRDGLAVAVSAADRRIIPLGDGAAGDPLALPDGVAEAEGIVVPEAVSGELVPVLSPDEDRIYVASPAGPLTIELEPGDHGAPVGFADRIYVPRHSTGELLVFSATGRPLEPMAVPGAEDGEPFDLRLEGGYLWANAPTSRQALVIGPDGAVVTVDKYDPEAQEGPTPDVDAPESPAVDPLPEGPGQGQGDAPVPGSDGGTGDAGGGAGPPPTPPAPPPRPEMPTDDPTVPDAPVGLSGAVGSREVTLTWTAPADGGAPIDEYEISWSDDDGGEGTLTRTPAELGGARATLVLGGEIGGGLTVRNGVAYSFQVAARNEVGLGAQASAGPFEPTSSVPTAPEGVTIDENAPGRLTVSWDEGDGEGHEIKGYEVTALYDGVSGIAAATGPRTTEVTFGRDELTLGRAYRFEVRTVTASPPGEAKSDPSPPSEEVVPYDLPRADAIEGIAVRTDAGPRTFDVRARAGWEGRSGVVRIAGDPSTSRPTASADEEVTVGTVSPGWGESVSVAVEACIQDDEGQEHCAQSPDPPAQAYAPLPTIGSPIFASQQCATDPNRPGVTSWGRYYTFDIDVDTAGVPPQHFSGQRVEWTYWRGGDPSKSVNAPQGDWDGGGIGSSGRYRIHGGWGQDTDVYIVSASFVVDGQTVSSPSVQVQVPDCGEDGPGRGN